MDQPEDSFLTLGLPSKGQLETPTLAFLEGCGLRVSRPNLRQYVASIPALPGIRVLFQRTADIFRKIDEGAIDVGITGFDMYCEKHEPHDDSRVLVKGLGYGGCELVLAVPESWIDVASVADVADLATLYKDKRRDLRISTKYPQLTRKWLHEKGIFHFTIVDSEGAHEAAPAMGYAEMIVDVVSSGTTLKENRLKRIRGDTLLHSEACLLGNKSTLGSDSGKLATLRLFLERLEAHLRARNYFSLSANISAESPEALGAEFQRKLHFTSLRGPTISKVFSKHPGDANWLSLSVVVREQDLMRAVDNLRKVGAKEITVSNPIYIFDSESSYFEGFLKMSRKNQKAR